MRIIKDHNRNLLLKIGCISSYNPIGKTFRKNLKLSAKFFGPYKILDKIGNVVDKLNLLETSRGAPSVPCFSIEDSYWAG